MMTLQEAIDQEKRLAEMSYHLADSYHTDENVYMTQEARCRENAEHHEQIAEWLEELQELKKESEEMKNETARREIEALDHYLQNHTNDYSEKSHAAMMMAIEALEMANFPTYKEIAKKAVEEALDGYIYQGKTLREWIDIVEQWQELKETIIELRDSDGTGTQQEICKFLTNYMDVLEKNVSSSENPNQWISCIERLPEKNGNYLVTVESGDGTASIRYRMVEHYNHNGSEWLHDGKKQKVIAWMPLPEPYKAESEGE